MKLTSNSHTRVLARTLLAAGAAFALLGLAACGDDGEDRPNVEVVDDGGSGSVSGTVSVSGTGTGSVSGTGTGSVSGTGTGSASATGTGSASGSGTGAGIEPGVVEDQPEGSTKVEVTLKEWEVTPATAEVEAGEIYFLVENAGPEDAHEFVVIRTDEPADSLPVEDGAVPENEVDVVDEIEPFAPGSSASITLNLPAGNYALICNIAETEDGELESHYELGMHAAFTVK